MFQTLILKHDGKQFSSRPVVGQSAKIGACQIDQQTPFQKHLRICYLFFSSTGATHILISSTQPSNGLLLQMLHYLKADTKASQWCKSYCQFTLFQHKNNTLDTNSLFFGGGGAS